MIHDAKLKLTNKLTFHNLNIIFSQSKTQNSGYSECFQYRDSSCF